MLSKRALFEFYVGLLRRVIAARGGDLASVEEEYIWSEGDEEIPKSAASLSPLLTGGSSELSWAQGDAPSGVVTVPSGLTPPPRR